MNKKYLIIILFLFYSVSICYSDMDEGYSQTDRNNFLIDEKSIEEQTTQSQLEEQSLAKEAKFNLQVSIRENYFNEIFNTFWATINMLIDLSIMFFIIIFIRMFIFITFELFPMGINIVLDSLEDWF